MLPVINQHCIFQAVKSGLGLNAKVNLRSVFERKNYFYADLPQGYQISQFKHPIVGEGLIKLRSKDGKQTDIGIERIHLEQDAGKSIHDQNSDYSLIDLNRSGVCLMEIVSNPDIRSPEDAGQYVRKLRSILRYLGTCDGNMEEGSMRADVNVSVRKKGEEKLRTRTETKNVNSIRFIMQTIEIEAKRQVSVWESGEKVIQETRLLDTNVGETRRMRSKEFAHDYRYFPDPDLLPLDLTQDYIDEIRLSLPELPDAKKNRYIRDFGIGEYDADNLVSEKETAMFFEKLIEGRDGKLAANWITSNLFGALNKLNLSIENSPVSADYLGKLLDLITGGVISGRIAKEVFEVMIKTGGDPSQIVKEKGLQQLTDLSAIEIAVDQVIAKNAEQVEQIKNGNTKVVGWFVGQVMKVTRGTANPVLVNQLLKKKLRL